MEANNICIAIKERMTKDSGIALESSYDNIVRKLYTKQNARGMYHSIIVSYCSTLPSLRTLTLEKSAQHLIIFADNGITGHKLSQNTRDTKSTTQTSICWSHIRYRTLRDIKTIQLIRIQFVLICFNVERN